MCWYVYIVKCNDDSLYTGVSNNIDARVTRHNLGKGAKYTRARLPVELVYSEKAASRGAALRREFQIKSLTATAKKALFSHS
ncbi:MAG: GIY-YIG nuclease family protein [Gammaproteobacteria bacterium]|nr:GIY-YIG nuclease family protein [Gammaproteobacteria bacterium]